MYGFETFQPALGSHVVGSHDIWSRPFLDPQYQLSTLSVRGLHRVEVEEMMVRLPIRLKRLQLRHPVPQLAAESLES